MPDGKKYSEDQNPALRRPWWKRKRSLVVVIFWLVAYVLSLAPAAYIAGRYPVTEIPLTVVFSPVIYCVGEPAPDNAYVDFVLWCGHRGEQDRADSMRSDLTR